MLSAISYQLSAIRLSSFAAVTAVAALAGVANAQSLVFSTHDWTVSTSEFVFGEAWADVKSPGGWPATQVAGLPPTTDGRRTYAVGNVEVLNTTPTAQFSGQGVLASPLQFLSGAPVQVALVQVNSGDTVNGTNLNNLQFFFNGISAGAVQHRATNARAISVWEAPAAVDRRIAICGETYDDVIPASQSPAGWLAANANNPSGFIAVFDGAGALLWSYHFFSGVDPDADCAVTDLSIRVDAQGNDVVTYCGIFSHGTPAPGSSLEPVLPFGAPAGCSSGNTVQAAGQWDGFVGRLVRVGGATTRPFHSIVGGPGQDGLFGLAEIDEDRFAVVGSSQADAGQSGFPLPKECGLAGPYVLGAALVFDAGQVPSGNLLLESGSSLGTAAADAHSMARDVIVGQGAFFNGSDMIYVVGSTDDPQFATAVSWAAFPFAPPPGQNMLNGPTDGFVAALELDTVAVPAQLTPWTASFHGGAGDDGLTGIQSWNEYPEHMSVVGFTDHMGTVDIDVASYFFNNAYGPGAPSTFTGPSNLSLQLLRIRATTIGGGGEDRPAVMGVSNATSVGLAFNTFGLGQPTGESGGGVAVGENGRTYAVGRSNPTGGYPVIGIGARVPDAGADAVRTEVDLLPSGVGAAPGSGRTDGTGFQPGVPAFPPAPATGLTGGTTPFCALAEYGDRVGQPTPATGLRRMLIDFEGNMVAGSNDAAIIVSQPNPTSGSVLLGVLQFGFPPATPWAYLSGTEFWLGGGTYSTFPATTGIRSAYRMPLATLPSGGGVISAQMTCFLSSSVGSGACSSPYSASAALWFSY